MVEPWGRQEQALMLEEEDPALYHLARLFPGDPCTHTVPTGIASPHMTQTPVSGLGLREGLY